jgi:hypothetical protein
MTPVKLGPMPLGRPMETVDELDVRAPLAVIYRLASDVERWPDHLRHYRFVKFRNHDGARGGIVEMSANRPFALPVGRGKPIQLDWPTWWLSEMAVDDAKPSIRFRHIGGITKGMDVEWTFTPAPAGTRVRIVHVWDGPPISLIGIPAAKIVIGPVFIHGIASRTLAGLASAAERESNKLLSGNPA